MIAPVMIVNLRPSQSPTGPAAAAPKKAPPVKTETTAPLSQNQYEKTTTFGRTHISLSFGVRNSFKKDGAATTPPMTPRSYLKDY